MDRQLLKDLFFANGTFCAGRWRNAALVSELSSLSGDCLSEKIWNQFHQRHSCHCGNPTRYINFTVGYRHYCSRSCAQTSPMSTFDRRHRHTKLWANPGWKDQTATAMKAAHFKNRTPKKLALLAERGITSLDAIEPGQSNEYRWKHSCGEIFTRSFARIAGIYCPVCHVSQGQGELYEEIKKRYKGQLIVNDRQAIAPKEIDIYLPALKLGFEFNGKYWHPGDGTREKNKSTECKQAGIKLVHVWEVEWKKDRSKTLKQLDKLLRAW
jgi:very-short-patch-repair endonuclease